MTTTMVKATDIVKVLGEGAGRVEALKSIDLSLAGGELTLLIGPSGSGKTTLLSVLGCMLSPTTGTMEIRGRSTTGLDAEELAELRRNDVGFVFQSYHLFPTLTAAEKRVKLLRQSPLRTTVRTPSAAATTVRRQNAAVLRRAASQSQPRQARRQKPADGK